MPFETSYLPYPFAEVDWISKIAFIDFLCNNKRIIKAKTVINDCNEN